MSKDDLKKMPRFYEYKEWMTTQHKPLYYLLITLGILSLISLIVASALLSLYALPILTPIFVVGLCVLGSCIIIAYSPLLAIFLERIWGFQTDTHDNIELISKNKIYQVAIFCLLGGLTIGTGVGLMPLFLGFGAPLIIMIPFSLCIGFVAGIIAFEGGIKLWRGYIEYKLHPSARNQSTPQYVEMHSEKMAPHFHKFEPLKTPTINNHTEDGAPNIYTEDSAPSPTN